jgi:hypothetical protein
VKPIFLPDILAHRKEASQADSHLLLLLRREGFETDSLGVEAHSL